MNVWFALTRGDIPPLSCTLALSDNSSAVGWLHKASFHPVSQSPYMKLSRHFASLALEHDICLYSEHFPGAHNIAADSLSRDFHLDDFALTHVLSSLCPSQIPSSFRLSILPPEISYFITSTLEAWPEQKQKPGPPTRSAIGAGFDGMLFSQNCPSATIHSLITSRIDSVSSLSALSLQLCAMEPLADQVKSCWQRRQHKRPWTKWLRASSQIAGQIHG